MNNQVAITTLFLIALISGCGGKHTISNENNNSLQTLADLESPGSPWTVDRNRIRVYYVSSEKPVKYYDSPEGKPIGSFYDGYQLNTISSISKKDQEDIRWHGVLLYGDTVYVMNSNLADTHTAKLDDTEYRTDPIKLYELSSYSINANRYNSFIILSEGFSHSRHEDSTVIDRKYLTGKNAGRYHRLTGLKRRKFLDQVSISEEDSVFLYNTDNDSLSSLAVKDLPLIASLSVYADYAPFEPYDFQIGFDLDSVSSPGNAYYHTFICVTKNNPFITGETTPIVWEKTKKTAPPLSRLKPDDFNRLSSQIAKEVYSFKYKNLEYMLVTYQIPESSKKGRRIIVKDAKGEILLDRIYATGESTDFLSMSFKDESNNEFTQRTGRLLKNRPSVLYGITTESFGCRHVDFLAPDTPPLVFLCDNRH